MKFFAAILVSVALIACGTAPAPTPPVSRTWLPFQRGLPTHTTILALAVDPRDAVVHLGGSEYPSPWVPLYRARNPSADRTGEFRLNASDLQNAPRAVDVGDGVDVGKRFRYARSRQRSRGRSTVPAA